MANKYEIVKEHIPVKTLKYGRRPGRKVPNGKYQFIVLHEVGNDKAGAKQHRKFYMNTIQSATESEWSSSAQTFIDAELILEVIPTDAGIAECANHVRNSVEKDNDLYGHDSNKVALGVELCLSRSQSMELNKLAYDKYVWYVAYKAKEHGLSVPSDIVSHKILDPSRRSDPDSAIAMLGKSYRNLLEDIVKEYEKLMNKQVVTPTAPIAPAKPVVKPDWRVEQGKKAIEFLATKTVNDDGVESTFLDKDYWIGRVGTELPWFIPVFIARVVKYVDQRGK